MIKINSIQKWIPIENIFERGIIKIKKNKYIKILKVIPINFNLKTQLEKETILKSFKTFLKTCNFDMQILIQSKKEDLTNHIEKIKEIQKKENNKTENNEENIFQELNEKYFKIKDGLLRCGNLTLECNKEETKKILFSFFNTKIFLEK